MRAPLSLALRIVAAATAVTAGPVMAARGDRPLKIIQTSEARLPDPANPDVPPSGEVRFALLVDETGQLRDMLLLGSTHRAFTDVAVAGLQAWKFEPAQHEGQPVSVRTVVRVFFESQGRVVTVRGGEVLPSLVGRPFGATFDSRLVEPAELDAPLQPVHTVNPGFPAQLLGRVTGRSSVWIDFFVDETGAPRMPVVLESDHPLLAAAALDALEQWRFEPPRRDRLPIIVHVKQEFVFQNLPPADES